MKKWLATLAVLTAFSTVQAQDNKTNEEAKSGIQLPIVSELSYYFGWRSHSLHAVVPLEMGVELEGQALTDDIFHPNPASRFTDKYYLGVRYHWVQYEVEKWEGSIGLGLWTYGLFYEFPTYPLQVGGRASLGYRLNDHWTVNGMTFLATNSEESEISIGLTYRF